MPRTAADIDAAIARVNARRLEHLAARDRRERDMLTALADVERYERQADDRAAELDTLLDDRADALQREIVAALR